MACVSTNKKTGMRRVLFVQADGTRTALYVGRVSKTTATEIGSHVDRLVLCQESGETVRPSTREWVQHIRTHWPRLANHLISFGLIPEDASDSFARGRNSRLCLADFVDRLITERKDVRPNTTRLWRQTATRIREYFGPLTIGRVTAKHGSDFKRWLISPSENAGAGYGVASAGKHLAVAKSFLNEAVNAKIIAANPFSTVVAERQRNCSRQRFIDSGVITRIISLCEDAEMQAVIALARWGGLRTPSEPFALQWKHIDWHRRRIEVQCVKTEARGKSMREIPLFPELVHWLTRLREQAESDSQEHFVLKGLRQFTDANLRKSMARAVRRAGIVVWPRIFQNLRASRQTELEERFPRKTVCEWMGNSEQVADQHYLQVREADFERAVRSANESVATDSE